MPQTSVAYAVARLNMVSKQGLDKNKVEDLLMAENYDEAKRILGELGWGSLSNENDELILTSYLEKASSLVKKLTTSPDITDCFFIKYDIHNIKTLIKARELGIDVDILSNSGIIPLSILTHSIIERSYGKIPEPILIDALDRLEHHIAKGFDPFAVDAVLDKAMYDIIFAKLNKTKHHRATYKYYKSKVDLVNAVILLRSKALDRDFLFFKSAYIPYGTFDEEKWKTFFEEPSSMVVEFKKYGRKLSDFLHSAVENSRLLPEFEKNMEDYLALMLLPYKKDIGAIEGILAYLLKVEADIAIVRFIMAAKANNFTPEAIKGRMRDLYG